MKAKWLVETTKFNDSTKKLVKEVRRQGMLVKHTPYIPIIRDTSYLDLFNERDCVIFYGSINFANQIQREAPWVPGCFYDKKETNCQYYYPRFGDYILNSDYLMVSFGDLVRKQEELYINRYDCDDLFIRPDSGSKSFTGTVVPYKDYFKYLTKFSHYDVSPETLVVVAGATNIRREYRLVVSDRVIAGSRYQIGKQLKPNEAVVPQEVLDYGEMILKEVNYEPSPVWILDICETSEGLHVLEVGSFSVAGLYNCDLTEIVKEVSRLAEKEYEDIYNE